MRSASKKTCDSHSRRGRHNEEDPVMSFVRFGERIGLSVKAVRPDSEYVRKAVRVVGSDRKS
jgi:hypothetical protein